MTEETHIHTPTDHSNVVGGSSAARVIGCPASVKLVQQMPRQPESIYAAEGTALHEAIEHALYEGLELDEVQAMVGMEFYGRTMTADLVEGALVPAWIMFDEYITRIEEEDGGVFVFAVERRGAFPGIEGAFGTADIVGYTPKRSVVWDWKFGQGVPVEAEHNTQGKFYACALGYTDRKHFFPEDVGSWGEAPEGWRVDIVIAQPRLEGDVPSIWETDIDELDPFIDELQDAVKEALGEEPRVARGEYCRWCTAQPVCPLYKQVGERLASLASVSGGIRPGDKVEITQREAVKLVSEGSINAITPGRLKEWLHQADIVEAWAKSMRQLAMDEAEAGRPPKGMKLVPKQGHLAYVNKGDFSKIDKMLANRGLTVKERRKVEPITPTQANKILKAKGENPLRDTQVVRPVTGHTLAPEDDPREAVETLTDKAAKAAARLASAAE